MAGLSSGYEAYENMLHPQSLLECVFTLLLSTSVVSCEFRSHSAYQYTSYSLTDILALMDILTASLSTMRTFRSLVDSVLITIRDLRRDLENTAASAAVSVTCSR